MSSFEKKSYSSIKRIAKRGAYDKKTVYDILDAAFICHVGFVQDNRPFVIPTSFGRQDEHIYIHGSSQSRMLKTLDDEIPVCITVTLLDALVLARSLFHHSMNYRSVVLFGKGKLVPESEKMGALKVISNHIIKDRWEEARHPNEKEMKATMVIKVDIETASAKIRTGPAIDDKEDLTLAVWAGIIPLESKVGKPIPDQQLKSGQKHSQAVSRFLEHFNNT